MTNVKEQSIKAHKVFEKFLASHNFISIGPKRSLETNISKKEAISSSGEKSFWPTFSRFIECAEPQETSYKGPQGNLTVVLQMTNSFFWDLIGR